MPGLFITLEGTEGSGKTTQMRLLVDRLRAGGNVVTENREPGATRIGAKIRGILLDPEYREMAPMTELLMMFASRVQAAEEIVLPALERGEIVVSDRFTDSTLAYQGAARGLGFQTVLELHRLALGSLRPDLTICLAVDVAEGLARARSRNQSHGGQSEARIDEQPLAFHERVREGYNRIAALEPARFRIVDASGSPPAVAERIWSAISPLL
ncbi:MAG TPA: dTMP kinase [Bryobacteraceae bacterium]